MNDVTHAQELIIEYRELYNVRMKSISAIERSRAIQPLSELEMRIRAALRRTPVPEPVGATVLKGIRDQLAAKGFNIFADRLCEQAYRHPLSVPFENLQHVRSYLEAHIDPAVLDQIPELAPKKQPPKNLFSRLGRALFKKK